MEVEVPYDALDDGIREAVRILANAGVEVFESCEGGNGHAYPEPTVRFHGEQGEGFRALGIAIESGLRVLALRRVWWINDGEPTGPDWEIVFPIKANREIELTSFGVQASAMGTKAASGSSLT